DNHRYQPGSGSLNFRKQFNQLKQNGYEGYITFECRVRGDNPEGEYIKSLRYLREALS
ncbi:TIM barrel protein, partial [Priestia megaterium]|uniref:TIM barrel protein n=1 Tax=Priestia megaterium TaxID=1404 RepID=UPI002FFF1398